MSNAEFLFILLIIICSQFDPLLTLNEIEPETCYEVTLNATSSYHAENKQPTKVNIDKVKQLLSKPHDIHESPTTCSNVKIELKNEPDFRTIPMRNITQLSLTFLIEPTDKMEKIEAYFCAENALQRASANETRLKDLLMFSEDTKPDLWLRIDQKSCCEEQELHFEACCRKGYALKNNTCQEKTDEIAEKCEVVKMEKEKCKHSNRDKSYKVANHSGPSLSLGIIIILAATCLVLMVGIILVGVRVLKIRHRPREPEDDVERPAVDTNTVETLEPNTEADVERPAVDTNTVESLEPNTEAGHSDDSTVPEYLKMNSFSTTRTQSTTASSRASSVNDRDKRPISRSEMMLDFKKHIPKSAIIFTGTVLGSGQFGRVELANVTIGGTTKKCAVKMIRGRGTNEDEKELFHELELLYQIPSHPNVVSLLGGCMDDNSPLYVVVEYCAKGNLLNYLKKKKQCVDYVNLTTSPLSFRWKMKRAIEICKGMIFLSSNQIIHRDLAARNILLDENDVAKISDFGMAKDVYLRGLYVKETAGFLPVRWMAIEAIESSIYTIKSDMWSFGILLWELYMDGQLPYPAISEANKLLDRLKEEYRMPKPENCPDSFSLYRFFPTEGLYLSETLRYELMGKCWLRKPDDRPAFLQTLRKLKVIKHEETKRESAASEEADSSDEQPLFEEQEEPPEAYGDKIFTNNTNAVGLDNYGHSRNSDIELNVMTNTKEETTTL